MPIKQEQEEAEAESDEGKSSKQWIAAQLNLIMNKNDYFIMKLFLMIFVVYVFVKYPHTRAHKRRKRVNASER
jgi:hypothetical protein